MFGWVHEISVLAQFCSKKNRLWYSFVPLLFTGWHKFVPEKKTDLKMKPVIFLEKIQEKKWFLKRKTAQEKKKKNVDRL
ncbi:hypothetical protein [Planococcus salinus]|uniref:Uncharacterized protein n=1 Tax=Planococcus salinus TaxID=1848460 RepID=A0A3M8P3X5_9BACL|nr:hypothetical protein [Planococcus salinus]RNF38090.1 hypothetical protein EEX84_16390 [Planococcus salinus]